MKLLNWLRHAARLPSCHWTTRDALYGDDLLLVHDESGQVLYLLTALREGTWAVCRNDRIAYHDLGEFISRADALAAVQTDRRTQQAQRE